MLARDRRRVTVKMGAAVAQMKFQPGLDMLANPLPLIVLDRTC